MTTDPHDDRRVTFSVDFPEAVSRAMSEQGLTGNAVAARTGHQVKKQTISRIRLREQPAMSASRFRLLCEALGLRPDDYAQRPGEVTPWLIPPDVSALVPEDERPHVEWLVRRLYTSTPTGDSGEI